MFDSPAPTKPKVVINYQSVFHGIGYRVSCHPCFRAHIQEWPDTTLQVSHVKLCTYSDESLQVLGQIEVKI